MPSASNEDRQKMEDYFGDGIDDTGPTNYLQTQGYTEHGGWWKLPSSNHKPTEKEWDCLNFLCDEWDHAYDFTQKG